MTTMVTDRDTGPHDRVPSGHPGQRRVDRRVGLPSGRAVVGGLLMALAAVGTFLAYQNATADDSIAILVAVSDLRVGDIIAEGDVALVDADLPDGTRGLFGSTDAAVGRQIIAQVNEGEFLLESATSEAKDGDEVLEVMISVPGSRLGGAIRAGERVDVFSTWGDVTELIAVDARVLDISGGGDGGLLASNDSVAVRLALADFGQIEAIVHANAAGDITLVHAAIGTETGDVGRRYRPGEQTPVVTESDEEDDN